jgi:hypothetical protein
MQQYDPRPGETINHACETAVRMANDSAQTVEVVFNDIILTVEPNGDASALVAHYLAECDRRHEEYITSDAYKAQLARAEVARCEQTRAAAEAEAAAPKAMSLADAAAWQKTVDVNSDGYGACTVRYAERWARFMEGRMSAGASLAECADAMSQVADTEGITGFMYGCAVSILSKCWIRGEDLRRWHNRHTQIRDEGDKANDKPGAVLNPALLSIG